MADEVEDQLVQALNPEVCTAEQSWKMRKALKQKILETVSTLRTLFVKIKVSGDRKTSEINNLTTQVDKLETERSNAGTSKQQSQSPVGTKALK